MKFLNDLVGKFKDDKKSDPVQIVAQRFKQLFTDHGVEPSQIPRIFPKVLLEDLKSDDALLKRLNPELLDEAATLFGVRVEWLEGEDERIYPHRSCYKHPQKFFELFNSIKYEKFEYPVRLITSAEKLDFRGGGYQPILIMLAEKIAEVEVQIGVEFDSNLKDLWQLTNGSNRNDIWFAVFSDELTSSFLFLNVF